MRIVLKTNHGSRVLQGSHEDLKESVVHFKANHVSTVVNLLDVQKWGQDKINGIYLKDKIREIKFPIIDFSTPTSTEALHAVVLQIAEVLKTEHVFIHCMGGKGRTGLLMACLYSYLTYNHQGAEALAQLRTRYPEAVETAEQAVFVSTYAAKHALEHPVEDATSTLYPVTLDLTTELDTLIDVAIKIPVPQIANLLSAPSSAFFQWVGSALKR